MTLGISELAANVADLYREIVTTSVRFDSLQRTVEQMLARMETLLDQHAQKVAALHDLHVRETALLEGKLAALDGRLTALSEQAFHAVARETAREVLQSSVGAPERRLFAKGDSST